MHLHVRQLRLDDGELARAAAELSPDECARAERFRLQEHRRRFIASHLFLRRILASHCGVPGSDIAWVTEPHGRPVLSPNPLQIHFSLSHSEDMAAVAVSRAGPVGVDIEVRRPAMFARVGAMVLSPREAAAIKADPQADLDAECLRYWVAKEAFLKLNGVGLSVNPVDVEIDRAFAGASCHHAALAIPQATLHWADVGEQARCALATSAATGATVRYESVVW